MTARCSLEGSRAPFGSCLSCCGAVVSLARARRRESESDSDSRPGPVYGRGPFYTAPDVASMAQHARRRRDGAEGARKIVESSNLTPGPRPTRAPPRALIIAASSWAAPPAN